MYLAYYLHWSLEEITGLTHAVRAQVIGEISRINAQLADGAGGSGS